jgi:hypothetical protein
MERERERPVMRSGGGGGSASSSWVTRPRNESSYDEIDRQRGGSAQQQQQSFIQDNFRPQQLQHQIFSQPAEIFRNPEQQNVVMVLPPGQGAGVRRGHQKYI